MRRFLSDLGWLPIILACYLIMAAVRLARLLGWEG